VNEQTYSNKDQSTSTKGKIAHLYSPSGSIGLTVWLQFKLHISAGERDHKSSFPLGLGTLI